MQPGKRIPGRYCRSELFCECSGTGNKAATTTLEVPHGRFAPIVLKKSFLRDGLKFSGPLMRLSRFDVRDHINCRKNDRWPSPQLYGALQRLKSSTRYICVIFGSSRFSSFSTVSAKSGRPRVSSWESQTAQHDAIAIERRGGRSGGRLPMPASPVDRGQTLGQRIAHLPEEASRAEARLVYSSSPRNRTIKTRTANRYSSEKVTAATIFPPVSPITRGSHSQTECSHRQDSE